MRDMSSDRGTKDMVGLPDRAAGMQRTVGFSLLLLTLLFSSLYILPPPLFAETVPEKLIYSLSWTGIAVGTATQEIVEDGDMRRINSTARSNDWLSVFFPVEDVITSSLSKEGAPFPGLTRQYRMQIREGKRRRDREIIFDQAKGIAQYIDHLSPDRAEIPIGPNIYDVYASFYYVRNQKLEVGKSVYVAVLDGKEVQNVEIQVVRKEKIRTILGEVDTIVIKPIIKSKGVFEGKGSVHIWLTDDARRIPVKAQTKVTVGSVTATLVGGTY